MSVGGLPLASAAADSRSRRTQTLARRDRRASIATEEAARMIHRTKAWLLVLLGVMAIALPASAWAQSGGFLPGDDPCSPNPCLHGGLCTIDGDQFAECHCQPGWIGQNCDWIDPDYVPTPTPVPTQSPVPTASPTPTPVPTPSPDPTPTPNLCDPDPCLNGGTCSTNGFLYSCSCPGGFGGHRCGIPSGATLCSEMQRRSNCDHNSECYLDEDGFPTCACAYGWDGQHCDVPADPPPTPEPTATPTPTPTLTPTLTPTPTLAPTPTPAVTPSLAPTATPTLVPTPTASPLPTPMSTPTSDPTPSPRPTSSGPIGPGVRDDYDADGRTDPAVYEPTDGTWSVRGSQVGLVSGTFGGLGWQAVPGDWDGDGVTDPGLFAVGSKLWWYAPLAHIASAVQIATTQAFDLAVASGTWVPAPGDYDGDGVTDVAVYGPDTGLWVIQRSSDDGLTQATLGGTGYRAVPADFDGDGKLDVAVYQIATGAWSYLSSSQSTLRVDFQFSGGKRFLPVPADYDGDGRADPATYQKKKGKWRILPSTTGVPYTVLGMGGAGQVATPGDFDGDGKVDPAAYRAANGLWRYLASSTGDKVRLPTLGGSTYDPLVGQQPQ
jgi:hypothetical protein